MVAAITSLPPPPAPAAGPASQQPQQPHHGPLLPPPAIVTHRSPRGAAAIHAISGLRYRQQPTRRVNNLRVPATCVPQHVVAPGACPTISNMVAAPPGPRKFNCTRYSALGSFRACCLLCAPTRSGRPSSSTSEIVRPAAADLAARLGLAGAGLRRYPGGSRPVYAVGDRLVLKIYPTVSAPDSVTEARVLEYLSGKLPVATPELLAHGEYENGWRYVLMSRLPGTELAAAWPAIPRPHQDRVVEGGECSPAARPRPRPCRRCWARLTGRLRQQAHDGRRAPA